MLQGQLWKFTLININHYPTTYNQYPSNNITQKKKSFKQ